MAKPITVFTILVYTCSKEEFESRWEKNISDMARESVNPEEVVLQLYESIGPVREYNRVMGYIVVNIDEQDVFIDAYKSDLKRISRLSKLGGSIRNLELNGNHFRHVGKTNAEIADEIEELVTDVSKTHFARWDADIEDFMKSNRFMDYVALAKSIGKDMRITSNSPTSS